MRKFHIVTVCGCGLGTSLMAKMSLEEIMDEAGYYATIENIDIGSSMGIKADFIVTTEEFAKKIDSVDVPIIEVSNFVNNDEMKEKVLNQISKLL